jgi:hypothetical protein
MCVEWVNHCDGKLIFPKLPFYMRAHYKSWKRNQAARQQVDSANFKKGAEILKKLNKDSSKSLPRPQVQAPWRVGDEITANAPAAAPSNGIDVSTTSGGGKVIAGMSIAAVVHPKAPERIRTRGQRAADKGKRAARKCALCKQSNCPGAKRKELCRSICSLCNGRNCPGKLIPMACTASAGSTQKPDGWI